MPYIKNERRYDLIHHNMTPLTSGELNYVITEKILRYLHEKGESYQTYNDIIGVLECVKQELYRRKITDYENKKIKENGDVY